MDLCKENVYLKNCVKVFPEGGGFVNITDPEGGPTATGMIPEGGTTEKKLPSNPPPPHKLINGTALNMSLTSSNFRSQGFLFKI